MTLPTLTVLLDDGTGTFPYDVSRYVLAGDGYTFSRGRADWQGAVTAGQLDLSLNNADGRFTPGSTLIATPSPIKVDQKIRLKETINGATYTRFTGYVKSWPVTWPATVATVSTVKLTATDVQAAAERRQLRSVLEEEIVADQLAGYYTLSEPSGSVSAGDTSGNQCAPLTILGTGTPPDFGGATGPGTDGLSATAFAGGQYLGGPVAIAGAGTVWLEVFFTTTGTSQNIASLERGTSNSDYSLSLATSGSGALIAGVIDGSGVQRTFTSAGAYNDGGLHQAVAVYVAGTGVTLYVDGQPLGTSSATSGLLTLDQLRVGGSEDNPGGPFVGGVSHVAYGTTAPSAGRIAAHFQAAHDGFTGESGTARLTRLAGYAGVPVGTLDASLTNVSAGAGWSGSSAGSQIQATADAEFGLTYIDGTGSLTFHNRNRAPLKTAPDLTLGSQWITPEMTPTVDDQQIVNYMEVTAEGTGATGLVRNPTSETAHGRYSGSQSYVVQTDQEALDRGNWIVSNFAEPTPRYGTLTINLYGMTAAMASSVVAALDLDCWLRVVSMAPQNPGGTVADVVVEGFQATATGAGWSVTCNVVSRSLFAAWILDDATYSVLDSTTRLYV